MPRKKPKKNIDEMTDRELLRQVFPERVVRRVEEEIGLRNQEEIPEPESEIDFPNDPSL